MIQAAPGKQDFIRRVLRADPDAGLDAINRAWRESGREGSISRSSCNRVRAAMLPGEGGGGGDADSRPGSSPGQGPAPAPPADQSRGRGTPRPIGAMVTATDPLPARAEVADRRDALRGLEEGLDRLLFRAIGLGDVPEVEDALRGARRLVILAGLPCRPRVAVVGASADRAKFGNKAVRALARAGFEVYPINPRADRVEGLRAYPSLDDLPAGPLDRVSLYVPAAAALGVLDQIARRRVGQVWLNPGADAPEVVERAHALGLEVVLACSILAVGEHPDRL